MAEVISSHRTLLMGLLAEQPLTSADLRWAESTTSTNTDLMNDLSAGAAAAWSIRIASTQTNGRGRLDRIWETPNGSLPISIAVPMRDFQPAQSWLSVITAIALKSALQKYVAKPISIKWPNDCLTEDGKFAGILIELKDTFAVVGIGINFFAAPNIPNASHLGITDYVPALADFLLEFVSQIQNFSQKSDSQVRQIVEREISTIGQEVEVEFADGRKIIGIADSLTDSGALVVKTSSGQIQVVTGDVIHLRAKHAS